MKKLITCLVVCVLSGAAFATTWTVDDDGKADFDNIQAAVDAASDGDEIIVMPGTYTGSGDWVIDLSDKAVWLHSSEGSATTLIDGENARGGLACIGGERSDTIISGFTITNGFSLYGGGMYCGHMSPTITNCIFENNTANVDGGGMYNYSSWPTLTDCTFTNNTAPNGSGGGIFCSYTHNMQITNLVFENNSASYGGGIIVSGETSDSPPWNLIAEGCSFVQNTSTELFGGGGMFISSSSNVLLFNNKFCENSLPTIAGYYFDGGGNIFADVCPVCPADINGDVNVNVSDLLTVIDQWGLTNSPADVNDDGIVDVSDLLIVIGNWGECLPGGDCSGNGLVDNYTATVSSPCMGTTIPASDISLALALNSSCSVTGTANVYGETPAVTTTTWSHASGILTIGSFTAPVAESATTFTTPLEQIFPAVAAAVLACFDLLPPNEQDEIIANCGSPEAYVSGLQMTWTR